MIGPSKGMVKDLVKRKKLKTVTVKGGKNSKSLDNYLDADGGSDSNDSGYDKPARIFKNRKNQMMGKKSIFSKSSDKKDMKKGILSRMRM